MNVNKFQKTVINIDESFGFTLIELLVSIAIFIIVIAITANIFFDITKNQRAAQESGLVIEELNYIVEVMKRSIQKCNEVVSADGEGGEIYLNYPGANPGNNCPEVPSDCLYFGLDGERIIQKNYLIPQGIPLNSAKTKITSLKFLVQKGTVENPIQPKVTISIVAQPATPATKTLGITLQTTVSKRELEL